MSTHEIQGGSLRELWRISSSLMISSLSLFAMIFCDRIFLSYYSTDALNAASSAGTLYWAGALTWITLAAMAEVFVAQYNGAKKYDKLAQPIWQMIYLSGISFLFFFSLASFGSQFGKQIGAFNEHEMIYYRWNNYFVPLAFLLTTLSAFYIGQGKTRLIQYLGILGNGINILLDPLFIFGYKDWIPEMGIKGAAIATGIGQAVQLIIIGALFFQRHNRRQFQTGKAHFHPTLCWKCVKIGLPAATFVLFEMIGWSLFYFMMKQVSPQHILISSILQSILLLLVFFGQGLEKGAAAVTGNLIGAKRWLEVHKVVRSGIYLSLLFGVVLSIFLIFYPKLLLNAFLHHESLLQTMENSAGNISAASLEPLKEQILFGMGILVIYLTLENIRWLFSGILTAAGDTLFLMIAGSSSIWIFLLVPTYFLVLKTDVPIKACLSIWILYSCASSFLYAIRFFQGKWKKKHLIKEETKPSILMEP